MGGRGKCSINDKCGNWKAVVWLWLLVNGSDTDTNRELQSHSRPDKLYAV